MRHLTPLRWTVRLESSSRPQAVTPWRTWQAAPALRSFSTHRLTQGASAPSIDSEGTVFIGSRRWRSLRVCCAIHADLHALSIEYSCSDGSSSINPRTRLHQLCLRHKPCCLRSRTATRAPSRAPSCRSGRRLQSPLAQAASPSTLRATPSVF